MSNFENNVLRVLDACAARNGRWLSTSSCAHYASLSYDSVRNYIQYGDLDQVAAFWHYEYRVKRKDRTTYLSVVRIGYV